MKAAVASEKAHRIIVGIELLLLATPTSLLLLFMLIFAVMELPGLTGRDLVLLGSFLVAAACLVPFWNLAIAYVMWGSRGLHCRSYGSFRMLEVAVLWVIFSWILAILYRMASVPWNPDLLGLFVTGCFGTLVAIPAAHLLFLRRALS